jgi:hypothetical protein
MGTFKNVAIGERFTLIEDPSFDNAYIFEKIDDNKAKVVFQSVMAELVHGMQKDKIVTIAQEQEINQ